MDELGRVALWPLGEDVDDHLVPTQVVQAQPMYHSLAYLGGMDYETCVEAP